MSLDGLEPLTANSAAVATAAHDVSVWVIDRTLGDPGARFEGLLSPEERARAGRFQSAGDRARFIAGRAQLRLVLGHCLRADPASIRFDALPGGKPLLATPGCAQDLVRFNASSAGALAIVAVCRSADIGVDIEHVRDFPDVDALANRLLSTAELAEFRQVQPSSRGRRFLEYWVRKEAIAKCVGSGLAEALDRLSVHPWSDAGASRVDVLRGGVLTAQWVAPLGLPVSGHVAAIACAAPVGAMTLRRWTPALAAESAQERLEPLD